jgi:putative intracellular protease/amidase
MEMVNVMLQKSASKRLLMVVTNPATNLQGWPVGFWGCELSHPYFEFTSAGYEVDIVSPNGGKLELDAGSDPRNKQGFETKDLLTMGLLHTPELASQLQNSRALSEVDLASYEAMIPVRRPGFDSVVS